jgi:UDP-N-acetylglucosamine--N-acetylmuramyl-(pentapeptide) pyrophosphoryl-undecaprenol N-acetylglucosamine transferase
LPRSAKQLWRFLADNFAGARAAASFVREQQVSLVVGLGGYASVPMGRAAVRGRTPLLLLEQNAYPGRATRLLAPKADVICLALAKARLHLRTRRRVLVTGNPVRAEFVDSTPHAPREDQHHAERDVYSAKASRRLVVLGGSAPRWRS